MILNVGLFVDNSLATLTSAAFASASAISAAFSNFDKMIPDSDFLEAQVKKVVLKSSLRLKVFFLPKVEEKNRLKITLNCQTLMISIKHFYLIFYRNKYKII